MARDPYAVLTDQRQSTRFEREYGMEPAVFWTTPGYERLGYVHDESLGGLGVFVDESRGLEVGREVDIVYGGQLLRGKVRHVQSLEDGGYLVGFQCESPQR